MQRSLEKRLAELEALEVAAQRAEAERPLDATDADELTDDEVLAYAWEGLRYTEHCVASLVVANGTFWPTSYWDRDFWLRVGERAWAICGAREICLVPMEDDELRSAIALLEQGRLTVRPLPPQARQSHDATITCAWAEHTEMYPAVVQLWHMLDAIAGQVQRGGPFAPLERLDDVLAVLRSALSHGQIPDVWRAPSAEPLPTVSPPEVAPPIVQPVELPPPDPEPVYEQYVIRIGKDVPSKQQAIDKELITRRSMKWGRGAAGVR